MYKVAHLITDVNTSFMIFNVYVSVPYLWVYACKRASDPLVLCRSREYF